MTAYDGNVAITGAWLHNSQAASCCGGFKESWWEFRFLAMYVLSRLILHTNGTTYSPPR